jgi:hypothetical protein
MRAGKPEGLKMGVKNQRVEKGVSKTRKEVPKIEWDEKMCQKPCILSEMEFTLLIMFRVKQLYLCLCGRLITLRIQIIYMHYITYY